MSPLWTQRDDLMPMAPAPARRALRLAVEDALRHRQRAGDLVPVGRGGERRAIGLANPGLPGTAYATPTLWARSSTSAATRPRRSTATPRTPSASSSRAKASGPSSTATRCAMRRGDLLLTPGWNFHGHHNDTDQPMAWIDGLDIPFVALHRRRLLRVRLRARHRRGVPGDLARRAALGPPGPAPALGARGQDELAPRAYRWEHTDARAARAARCSRTRATRRPSSQGHAAIRYINPTTGGDVMPTIRCRVPPPAGGRRTPPRHEVGSRVWQVFEGHRRRRARRRRARAGDGRPVRRAVLGAVVAARRQRSSTCSASTMRRSSSG